MKTSLASEIFVEADEVKATLAEEKTSNAHAVIQRQKIQGECHRGRIVGGIGGDKGNSGGLADVSVVALMVRFKSLYN